MCLYTVEKYKKVGNVNTQNDYETTSETWKREHLFFVFCKCVEIPRKQAQDCSKEFVGNNNSNFLEKLPITMMGGQRLKIGVNWPLASPYLQHWMFRKEKIYKGITGTPIWKSADKFNPVFTGLLKFVSAIFYQIFISHQMIALQKLWKILFNSSKKLISFSRHSNFCISVFPSFSPCQPLL